MGKGGAIAVLLVVLLVTVASFGWNLADNTHIVWPLPVLVVQKCFLPPFDNDKVLTVMTVDCRFQFIVGLITLFFEICLSILLELSSYE